MNLKSDLLYRQIITLSDGGRVLLRPLTADDRQNLVDLYATLNAEDLRLLRHNVSDPSVIHSWVDNLDYEQVLPVLALVGEQVVGNATLHFHHGPARHRAEVRIFLSKEILADQTNVIKAFKNLGFEQKCTLDDYFMLPDGEFRDAIHLIFKLRETGGEF
jgi:hypothetical protein